MQDVPTIAVVGSTMIDLIAYAPRLPERGETVVGDRFSIGFGGKGANQAVMARNLGARVAMVNRLGDDAYGSMTLENLVRFGIDTTYTEMVPGSSGVAPIWVEADGTNRIIVIPGANHRLTAPDAEAAIRSMAPPDVVVGQFEIPQNVTMAAFAAGRELGAITILNPAPAEPIKPDLLDHTDWLIPNESEFELLTGEPVSPDAAVRFAERTRTQLVITVGERGALVVTGEVTSVPAVECEPVDTTGAGDAFVGAFAFGVASGRGALDAVGLAVACASASVTRLGTQTSFPTPAECDDIKRSLGW